MREEAGPSGGAGSLAGARDATARGWRAKVPVFAGVACCDALASRTADSDKRSCIEFRGHGSPLARQARV